jgi:hypothetical protein
VCKRMHHPARRLSRTGSSAPQRKQSPIAHGKLSIDARARCTRHSPAGRRRYSLTGVARLDSLFDSAQGEVSTPIGMTPTRASAGIQTAALTTRGVLYCPSFVSRVMIRSTFLFPHIPVISSEQFAGAMSVRGRLSGGGTWKRLHYLCFAELAFEEGKNCGHRRRPVGGRRQG